MSKRKQPPRAPFARPRDEDGPDESGDLDTAVDDGRESRPRRRRSIDVLHRDDDLIVVNKPVGTAIEAGFEDDPSVFEQLARRGLCGAGVPPVQAQARRLCHLHIVCPLDAEAGGLLLLVTRLEAAELLRQRLADGTLEACYLALVRGRIASRSGTIDRRVAPQILDRPPRIDDQRGLPAVTDWSLRDGFVGYSLLECRPRTAVPGQIRVHLASAGMPLVVDHLCGGLGELRLSSFKADYHPSRRHAERPLIARLTLHALSVRLPHPATGAELRFEAPLPKDFRAALYQLDKYGRLPPV